MEDDPYGFSAHLEKDAAKVLDTAGRAAFVKMIRERLDAAATATPAPGESFRRNPEYARRRWGEILRTLYVAQKNVEAPRWRPLPLFIATAPRRFGSRPLDPNLVFALR